MPTLTISSFPITYTIHLATTAIRVLPFQQVIQNSRLQRVQR